MSSLKYLALIGCFVPIIITGCQTPEQQAAQAALNEKAKAVRLGSGNYIKDCTYIDQVAHTESLDFLTGQSGTEAKAKWKLKRWAVRRGGDTLHITDRLWDKGRGGYDKTRLSLYADLYICKKEEAASNE